MASFQDTTNPTPFGIFDSEKDFIIDANSMVTFVKRKLGDDILSVELTNKQVWMSFEEATLEYSRIINEYQTKSQLGNLLGNDLGTSTDDQAFVEGSNDTIDGGPRGGEEVTESLQEAPRTSRSSKVIQQPNQGCPLGGPRQARSGPGQARRGPGEGGRKSRKNVEK